MRRCVSNPVADLATARRGYLCLQAFLGASAVGFGSCTKLMPPGELGSGAAELETETTPGFGELGDVTSELRTGTYGTREEVEEGEAKAAVVDAESVGLLLTETCEAGAGGAWYELPSGQNVIRRSTYMRVEASSANVGLEKISRWAHIIDLAGDLNLIIIGEMERGSAVRGCTYTRLFSFRDTVQDNGSHTGRTLAVTTIDVAVDLLLLWIFTMSRQLNAPESDRNVQCVPWNTMKDALALAATDITLRLTDKLAKCPH